MNHSEIEIYSSLFRIVKDNMEKSGYEMIPSEEAFLAVVGTASDTADLLRLRNLGKSDFIQAAFATILRRFPDDGALMAWGKKRDMPDEEYRSKLITTLINSAEHKQKNLRICNNIYMTVEKQPIQVVVQTGYGGMDRLMKIYSRMPKWMKKFAKKILK